MASALFSSIQSLSTNLLKAISGTPSTSHQQQDPPCPVTDQQKSVREDLEKLSRMLARIQAILQDAEEREIHDCSVRLWLAELRGVAYQAEDVLDEFYYEVLRSIVESGDAAIEAYHRDGGTKRKIAEMYASSSLASYSVTKTKASIPDGMAKEIKDITERFEEISDAREKLHLREEDGTRLVSSPQIRPPTSSHMDERATFGREEEKEDIISLMNPSTGPDFMVLPIVGMGGFGKTTLAQLVFNDSRIHGLFNKRCWVCVSEVFDPVQLTKAIVESVSDNPYEFSELSKLQDVLKEKIRGLGLFLVLDDVWNEQRNLWEHFRVGFLSAKFVRILTTTRNTSVAKVMQTTSPFQLSSLPEENCWSLFKHFAFGNRETSENVNLHEIGCGIVKKCKGSPLATKALGGILRYEMDEEKWREILESDISEIDETGEVMPALRLSYQKLPQHLKPCFLYLSMFPKDFNFEKDMVIRLWMAQGYINDNTRNLKTLEEIGSEYFDELQGRSLVDDGPWGYILHDLIHDLARSVSQEAYWPVLENGHEYNGPHKVCHMYFNKEDELLGLVPSNYRSIRTFVEECWPKFDFPIFLIACVRALQLSNCSLPNRLSMFKHLRYLSVRGMKVLPETLCLLYNLQTLVLDCYFLWELPENMKNLINLQYFKLKSFVIQHLPESIFPLPNLQTLSLRYCVILKELPRGIEQSTRLHILDLPESHTNMPSGGLRVLKDMNKLRGSLCISGLSNIVDVELCRNANLASKPNLHRLILNFEEYCGMEGIRENEKLHFHLTDHSSNNATSENDEKIHNVVLQSLQPHGNVRTLAILNYGGRNFPSWLLNPLLPKLTTLTLNFCTEPNFIPPFGQLPHLRFLVISGSTDVRNLGDEPSTYSLLVEHDSFEQPKKPSYPSLEELSLKNMLNLVEWKANDGDFPYLEKLVIENCLELWKIPTIPPDIKDVTFKNCPKLKFLTCPSVISNLEIMRCGFHEIMFHSVFENLTISNCLELKSINWSYRGFNSIGQVSFENCPKLELITIPVRALKLKIHDCGFREIKIGSIPESLTISNCVELISINWNDGGLNSVREVSFEHCPKLEHVTFPVRALKLKIHECGFREIKIGSIPESLTISNCVELISINWNDGGLNSVREVSFEHCPKLELVTFPVRALKLKIHECGFREIKIGSIPESLTISNCVELISINWIDIDLNSLRKVRFEYCPKLELHVHVKDVLHSTHRAEIYRLYLGERYVYKRDTTIKKLNLFRNNAINLSDSTIPLLENQFQLFFTKEDFREVESLTCAPSVGVSCQHVILNLALLVILDIMWCTKVISVTGLDNLSNLKCLSISYCPELCNWNDKTLPQSLEFLKLVSCDKLSSLPLLLVQNHSSTLEVFVIKKCPRLDELGERYVYQRDTMIKKLNLFRNNAINLSDSTIPLLENQFKLFFTKEDFREVESLTCAPSVGVNCQHIILNLASLVILEIMRCTKVISVEGLDNLSNLKCLSISFCPQLCNWNDKTLPLSLKFLELNYCDKLSTLPLLSVQNHLSTLEVLVITKCPRLDELVDFQGLMKLKTLDIRHCRNISISLATESLPRPRINIGDCPLMRDWCQRHNITYNEFYPPIGNPQDDREAGQESAEST